MRPKVRCFGNTQVEFLKVVPIWFIKWISTNSFKNQFIFHSFTATGNVLCTIDSLGQLYLYRLSPISDPCGPHVPASLQTMFEFCLVSALDWWDLTVCLKPSDVEAVCSRLEENFGKQKYHDYYQSRYMSLKRYQVLS